MDSPDPEVRSSVARDIVFLEAVGINPVVVHGGGKAISRAMKTSGHEPKFIGGQRYTDEKTIELVNQILSDTLNPEIVRTLKSLRGEAKGFPGSEIFTCRKHQPINQDGTSLDLGFVGEVIHVNKEPLEDCIRNNITPVISPVARGEDGKLYNCNADVAAAKVAIALNAKRLVFMSDVPGLLRDPGDPQSIIPHLQADDVDTLKATGVIAAGMIPKVDSAIDAVRNGVGKVSLVDGQVVHAVLLEIFTDAGVGTEVVL